MGRFIGVCAWLALLGGAPAAADPSASPPSVADAGSAPPVKEVILDPTVKEPVCRKKAPTGSRIARQRCEVPGGEAADRAERDQLRRDLDEVRRREVMRDQARAAAELDALRRRAGL